MTCTRFVCFWAGCLWLMQTASLSAAEALSTYLPAETALYVELNDLDQTWQQFEASDFGRRWEASRLRNFLLKTSAGHRWEAVNERIATTTGMTLNDHLRGLFARSVAVALFVPAEGEPQALLLARGRSAAGMQSSLDAWNRLEANVELESRKVGELVYQMRTTDAVKARVHYYALVDDLFVISDREPLVRDVLKNTAEDKRSPDRLAGNPHFLDVWPKIQEAGSATAWINPRAWDRLLEQSQDGTPGSQRLLAGWKGLRAVLARVGLKPAGVTARVQAVFNAGDRSEAWQTLVRTAASAPGIVEHAPANALIVVGGRWNPVPLVQTFRQLLSESDREKFDQGMMIIKAVLLEQDPWQDVGRALLQDWGAWLVASPRGAAPASSPLAGVWRSQLNEALWENPQLRPALENGITLGMNLLLILNNARPGALPLQLHREADSFPETRQSQTREWVLTGRPELDLAVKLTSGELVVATSAATLAVPDSGAADAGSAENTAVNHGANSTELLTTSRKYFPVPMTFLWCSLQNWRHPAADRKLTPQALLALVAPPTAPVVTTLSELFDELYVAVSVDSDSWSLDAGALSRPE